MYQEIELFKNKMNIFFYFQFLTQSITYNQNQEIN